MKRSSGLCWSRPAAFAVCAAVLVACESDQMADEAAEEPQVALALAAAPLRHEFENYQQIDALFQELDYTPESWRAGSRVVPRMYLTNIPTRYRKEVANQLPVENKKRVFFRVMAPIFLRANELVMEDRERLLAMQGALDAGGLNAGQRQGLDDLAAAYGLEAPVAEGAIEATLKELLVRVDIVPLSMSLAQAAEESGWGTSRFADEGNALFGQWTYGEGIKPAQQRAEKGDHRIAVFDTPLDSAIAYVKNLNTHRAYGEFRALRAAQRAQGIEPSGDAVVAGLTSYSERGADYVKSIRAIMRVNKLAAVDETYLADGPDITLVPVGPGSE